MNVISNLCFCAESLDVQSYNHQSHEFTLFQRQSLTSNTTLPCPSYSNDSSNLFLPRDVPNLKSKITLLTSTILIPSSLMDNSTSEPQLQRRHSLSSAQPRLAAARFSNTHRKKVSLSHRIMKEILSYCDFRTLHAMIQMVKTYRPSNWRFYKLLVLEFQNRVQNQIPAVHAMLEDFYTSKYQSQRESSYSFFSSEKRLLNEEQLVMDTQRTFESDSSRASLLASILRRVLSEIKLKYIQGMNDVAAFCIKYTPNETHALALAKYVFQDLKYCQMMESSMSLLIKYNKMVEKAVAQHCPGLDASLRQAGFDTSMLTTPWLAGMFTRVFSPNTVRKVWVLLSVLGWNLVLDVCFYSLNLLRLKRKDDNGITLEYLLLNFKKCLSLADEKWILESAVRRPLKWSVDRLSLQRKKGGLGLYSSLRF